MSSIPAVVYTNSGEPILIANPYRSPLIGNDGSSPESIIAKEVDRISQDIIHHLAKEGNYSPFFSSGCMGNAQYLIDYSTLIRTLVAPIVSNAFPDSCIQWEVEHGRDCIDQTMTQLKISRLSEVWYRQGGFWDQLDFQL